MRMHVTDGPLGPYVWLIDCAAADGSLVALPATLVALLQDTNNKRCSCELAEEAIKSCPACGGEKVHRTSIFSVAGANYCGMYRQYIPCDPLREREL